MPDTITASIDIGGNLHELIMRLSDAIGVTAEEVFPWYVKQVAIEGKVFMCVAVPFFIIALTATIGFTMKVGTGDNSKINIGLLLSACIFAVLCAIIPIETSNAIGKIYNPELFALKAMISDLKPMIP